MAKINVFFQFLCSPSEPLHSQKNSKKLWFLLLEANHATSLNCTFFRILANCDEEEEEVFSSIEGLVSDALKDRLGMALFGHLDWNSFNHGKFSSWGAIYCNNMIYLHFKGTSLSKLLCCIPEFTLHMYVLYFLGTYFYLVKFLEDT